MTPRPQNGFGVFFLIYFFGSGKGRFCRGFCEIWRAERGFLRGKSWWSCGENVAGNDSKLAVENMPTFWNLFLCLKASGNCGEGFGGKVLKVEAGWGASGSFAALRMTARTGNNNNNNNSNCTAAAGGQQQEQRLAVG
jgi:hypothetical protein